MTVSLDIRAENGTIVWLTTAPANLAEPTVAELDAGLQLDERIAGTEGFGRQAEPVDVSRTTEPHSRTITGREILTPPGLTLYDHGDRLLQDALTLGLKGWLVRGPWGMGAADYVEVWEVECLGLSDPANWVANEPATMFASFAAQAVTDGVVQA